MVLFRRFSWIRHLPDWECIRTFYPHWVSKSKDRRDDTLLGAVVDAFARHDIRFAPATDYVPELLVNVGSLAGRRLTHGQQKDVEFGWNLAKEMGRLDVGQNSCCQGTSSTGRGSGRGDGPVYPAGSPTLPTRWFYGR